MRFGCGSGIGWSEISVDEDAVGCVAGLLEKDGGGLRGGDMGLFSFLGRRVGEERQLEDVDWDVEPLAGEY